MSPPPTPPGKRSADTQTRRRGGGWWWSECLRARLGFRPAEVPLERHRERRRHVAVRWRVRQACFSRARSRPSCGRSVSILVCHSPKTKNKHVTLSSLFSADYSSRNVFRLDGLRLAAPVHPLCLPMQRPKPARKCVLVGAVRSSGGALLSVSTNHCLRCCLTDAAFVFSPLHIASSNAEVRRGQNAALSRVILLCVNPLLARTLFFFKHPLNSPSPPS